MKQVIRIIGGQYRGKKISFPQSEGLRPTPDRVRETVFNWLMHDIRNARCLDAFAGSGALGLEAFSRGAAEVSFIEKNNLVFNELKATIATFKSTSLQTLNTDTLDFLAHSKQCFDIIFLDPPYTAHLLLPCLKILGNSNMLSPQGVVYIESSEDIVPESVAWEWLKHKKAGQVFYGLLRRITAASI